MYVLKGFIMILYQNSPLVFYSGDREQSFLPETFYEVGDDQKLIKDAPFAKATALLGIKRLAVLRQIHSAVGFVINKEEDLFMPYAKEGDYLITNLPHVGLAVATADCLPIIAYDPQHKAIGVAHAGWKGTVAGVGMKMVGDMFKHYQSNPAQLQIFFCPSAGICCYEVDADFIKAVSALPYGKDCLFEDGEHTFFDLPLFNKKLLEACGVLPEHISQQFNTCTICDEGLCSYRRDAAASKRQITIATLIS